jgi:hypothetical protein
MNVFVAAILALLVSACSNVTRAPTLLQPVQQPPQDKVQLSDWHIMQFGESLLQWWGARSMRAQVFATTTGIALDAITTGALGATGGTISPDIVRGLVAGVNFLNALMQRIDPGARDNAFNEGAGIVLDAQGAYLQCLTNTGNAAPSTTAVSQCGAASLVKYNSAVKIVSSLMSGLLPQKKDLETVVR